MRQRIRYTDIHHTLALERRFERRRYEHQQGLQRVIDRFCFLFPCNDLFIIIFFLKKKKRLGTIICIRAPISSTL
jgi:hypothetical protein